MNRLTLPLVLCLVWASAAYGQAQPALFRKVAGPDVEQIVRGQSDDEGAYFRGRDLSTGKLVWIWVEHVTEHNGPDYEAADQADVVIWCYPNHYPHPNHALPDASGEIAVLRMDTGILNVVEKDGPFWDSVMKRREVAP